MLCFCFQISRPARGFARPVGVWADRGSDNFQCRVPVRCSFCVECFKQCNPRFTFRRSLPSICPLLNNSTFLPKDIPEGCLFSPALMSVLVLLKPFCRIIVKWVEISMFESPGRRAGGEFVGTHHDNKKSRRFTWRFTPHMLHSIEKLCFPSYGNNASRWDSHRSFNRFGIGRFVSAND